MKILLIEDDEVQLQVLTQALIQHNYVVDPVEDGQSGLDYAQSTAYDLILTDVGLPLLSGVELCRRLRSEGNGTPILLMTAQDDTTERIMGLDAGADDYLIKPLDLEELQARVRALLRRGQVSHSPVLSLGALSLDPSLCEVTFDGTPLSLTPKEYSLLELFMRNPARVFSRASIIEHLWTFDDPPQEESVKAHIKGLRQKLKRVGAASWIENIYGLGYRLNPKAQVSPVQDQGKPDKVAQELPAASVPEIPNPGDFDQAMTALWGHFQGLMLERLQILEEATAAQQAHVLSPELRQQAAQAAHKLAGGLGMFERDAGSRLARDLEQILSGSSPIQGDSLAGLVAELRRELDLPEEPQVTESDRGRIWVLAADSALAQGIHGLAHQAGMSVEYHPSWAEVEANGITQAPDLMILALEAGEGREQGLTCLEAVTDRYPRVPVLVLSGEEGIEDRILIARLGGRGVLTQPVSPAQVWEVALQMWQRSRAQDVTVLAVDDDPIFLTAVRMMLEPWGMRVISLGDPLRFWDVLNATHPDLLILDINMPDLDGIQLCQAVRVDPHWQSLPILFLTQRREPEIVQQVFAAGADDYATKPIVGPELISRITQRLERSRLWQTLARQDPITGLANARQAEVELERHLQDPRRPCCLAVVMVEGLRQTRIQYGHGVGDQVLRRCAHLLRSAFGEEALLSYWGDGEFLIGLPGTTQVQGKEILAERLLPLRRQIFNTNGERFQVICSVGTVDSVEHGSGLHSLYQAAHRVLARA